MKGVHTKIVQEVRAYPLSISLPLLYTLRLIRSTAKSVLGGYTSREREVGAMCLILFALEKGQSIRQLYIDIPLDVSSNLYNVTMHC